jgi:hypothetical protein
LGVNILEDARHWIGLYGYKYSVLSTCISLPGSLASGQSSGPPPSPVQESAPTCTAALVANSQHSKFKNLLPTVQKHCCQLQAQPIQVGRKRKVRNVHTNYMILLHGHFKTNVLIVVYLFTIKFLIKICLALDIFEV